MILLDGHSLTLQQLEKIAKGKEEIQLQETSKNKINQASNLLFKLANQKQPVYGINTGFGHLANVVIQPDQEEQLQINLLMSHACGMGEKLPNETVRAMMALRINALIQGYSGIRLEVIEQMLLLLNHHIIPIVYEQGSLGASGDLALLSHMSLPLLGLGEVVYQGKAMSAKEAYQLAGLKPLDKLAPKEGLCLINGTQAMCAIGGLVLSEALRLLDYANLALAFSMEALEGIIDAFDEKVHQVRGHFGQIKVAKQVQNYLKGSEYVSSSNPKRVQDAYSLRCAPQVHGASYGALLHVRDIVNQEMNAVTDNPLLFVEDGVALSAGNFHGEPLALAFDYMGMAIAELASISERRLERMVNPQLSNGLPPFLAVSSGVNSGMMIVQYTAASLVSENKVLAHPASVDSIPSSANQEDHVSMGTISARKARTILNNTRRVIALEMLVAFQAIQFRTKKQMGNQTKKLFDLLSKNIPFFKEDTILYPYMHFVEELLKKEDTSQILKEGD